MHLQHLNIKIPVANPDALKPETFNAVFQTWIQQKVCDELLIDVADYLHVPEGPGMLLVGVEADYSMDHSDGIWGLRYNRKKPVEGSGGIQLVQALRATLQACERLSETEALKGLNFDYSQMEISLNDRGLTPNTPENAKVLEAELKNTFTELLGQSPKTYTSPQDARERLGAHLTWEPALNPQEILAKLN